MPVRMRFIWSPRFVAVGVLNWAGADPLRQVCAPLSGASIPRTLSTRIQVLTREMAHERTDQ